MIYLFWILPYLIICGILWAYKYETEGQLIKTHKFRLGYIIAWYDLWIGAYKSPKGQWFIMIPMVGFTFTKYKISITTRGIRTLEEAKKERVDKG